MERLGFVLPLSVSMPTAQGQYVVTFDAKAGELYEFMISPRGSNIMGGYLGSLDPEFDTLEAEYDAHEVRVGVRYGF